MFLVLGAEDLSALMGIPVGFFHRQAETAIGPFANFSLSPRFPFGKVLVAADLTTGRAFS